DCERFKAGGVLDEINDYLKCLFLLWHSGFQSDIGRALKQVEFLMRSMTT
ncbi:hypothetical protein Tco_1223391, partial [Tanacetum coccineum]